MEKVITNPNRIRRPNVKTASLLNSLIYDENIVQGSAVLSLKTKVLAIFIFLYFFIENGTLGLIPREYYFIYRNVRFSDLILYSTVIYSVLCFKEYIDLFRSKSFLIVKILLCYILFEFTISSILYKFNVIEYFLRLKFLWASFLVFPYMLLLKRNGLLFLAKMIFPAAVISNVLYIMSAVTGIAYLPDISIVKQTLPGNFEVMRVFGGTFFGDLFLLAFVYQWITAKFRFYQLVLAILFVIPHILAFGRLSWVSIAFTFLVMALFNLNQKHKMRIALRQAFIFIILGSAITFSFLKFIPNSDYYADALKARIFQGEQDVKYSEGTYGVRIVIQNEALLHLWLKNNIFLGIGMHPMWVYRPETSEEIIYYSAFSDVTWPGVLAAYGIFGFLLAAIFQIFYIKTSYKLIISSGKNNIGVFMLTLLFARLTFDTFINFSYSLISFGLLGMNIILSFQIAYLVYIYEKNRLESEPAINRNEKNLGSYKYSYTYKSYRSYKLRDMSD